jgi:hypothetical protein
MGDHTTLRSPLRMSHVQEDVGYANASQRTSSHSPGCVTSPRLIGMH